MNKSFIFCYYKEKGIFWFRVFDRGLYFKNIRDVHNRRFSEEQGQRNYVLLNGWLIRVLRKHKT